ncbi:MAG: PASTA domain-containing protein [Cellulomonas sp.]
MLRADAEAAVLAAGLQPATTETSDPTIPVGTVLSASPAAGTVLPRGSTVALVVSSGPAPKPTPTPTPTPTPASNAGAAKSTTAP